MDPQKRMTGFIIHGFAVAHAAAAALLAQTLVGDEAVLTALTIAMIMSVARINGANWSAGETLAFLGIFIGTYVGTRGATFLVKWIPVLGNAANAAVTFGTTEALGWATYVFVRRGLHNPSNLSGEGQRPNKCNDRAEFCEAFFLSCPAEREAGQSGQAGQTEEAG